ncbi:iron complex transport system permease protein [Leucobacter luti]|uniref:Iron complex transport system permease protein n=1 Tax=Leucobacter luti TaxID=340320 RepID=A0A4R6S3W5_9MICO|nr:iron ABC transporter permease [Leucobacter luti]TDP93416.1 iron complex transport system permease protein [Leucobacter luti]
MGLLGLLAATLIASVSLGAVTVPVDVVWTAVAGHLGVPGVHSDPISDQIVWTVRVPRALLGALVGAGLAISGVVIQAVVRNPLGDPYLIGIMPGASLGAVSVIVLGASAVGGVGLSGAAFAGAMLAFAVVFLLGRHNGQWPPARLVLAGVAVGYLISSVTFFLQTIATPNQVQRVLFWSLGSVAGASWEDLVTLSVVVLAGSLFLALNGSRLNALSADTELTATLGINVARFQLLLMLVVALVTGSIVAVAGGIGFVGLVIPHIARLLVGADHRRVLTISLLLGAVFLPLADIAARLLRAPAELPIGVITAAVGAPFFLWLLVAGSGRRTRTRVTRQGRSPRAIEPAPPPRWAQGRSARHCTAVLRGQDLPRRRGLRGGER